MPHVAKNHKLIKALLGMRTSHQIIILLSIILICILIGGYLVVDQLKVLRNDAYAINHLGVIRGSIQLVSKQELNGFDAGEKTTRIDDTFAAIKTGYLQLPENLGYIQRYKVDRQLHSLEEQWRHLKLLYQQHRENKSLASPILIKSDLCWDLADNLVYRVQSISEHKLKSYRNSIVIVLSVISIIVVIIIMIVYRIIHNIVEFDAISDSLTKLYNRHYFDKILSEHVALHTRYQTHFTLTIFDIDYFKKVNDDYGHPVGDQILARIGRLLLDNTRDVDYIFRIGGEEFAVISPNCTLKQAEQLANKCRVLVASTDYGINRAMTISAGISQSYTHCDKDSLYKNADVALYEAKSTGRNKVVSFTHPTAKEQ